MHIIQFLCQSKRVCWRPCFDLNPPKEVFVRVAFVLSFTATKTPKLLFGTHILGLERTTNSLVESSRGAPAAPVGAELLSGNSQECYKVTKGGGDIP